jgi:hypothetical protein
MLTTSAETGGEIVDAPPSATDREGSARMIALALVAVLCVVAGGVWLATRDRSHAQAPAVATSHEDKPSVGEHAPSPESLAPTGANTTAPSHEPSAPTATTSTTHATTPHAVSATAPTAPPTTLPPSPTTTLPAPPNEIAPQQPGIGGGATAPAKPAPAQIDLATISAADVAELYGAVGRELKALEKTKGDEATFDLWPRYRWIRINEWLKTQDKRTSVATSLTRLRTDVTARR